MFTVDMDEYREKIISLIDIGIIPRYSPKEALEKHNEIVYDIQGNTSHENSYFFKNDPAQFYAWKCIHSYRDALNWCFESPCKNPTGIMFYISLIDSNYENSLMFYHKKIE